MASASSSPCYLLRMNDDEIAVLSDLIANPLSPLLAGRLSSCNRELYRAMHASMKLLKERRQKTEELCEFVDTSYTYFIAYQTVEHKRMHNRASSTSFANCARQQFSG